MPIVAAGLPVVLSLAWALLVEERPVGEAEPEGGGGMEGGLTDRDLWRLVVTGVDPLAGMRLQEAVRQDPRRVEAMMQQRLLLGLGLRPGDPACMLAGQAWGLRNRALREADGRITATALADTNELHWQDYQRLLEVLDQMKEKADEVRGILVTQGPALARCLREAEQIGRWAAAAAASEEDRAGWERMAALFGRMGQEMRPLLPGFGQLSGYRTATQDYSFDPRGLEAVRFTPTEEWQQYVPSGQRGPGMTRETWRTMGGRFY